jgi:hypothetical protein
MFVGLYVPVTAPEGMKLVAVSSNVSSIPDGLEEEPASDINTTR